MIMSRLDAQNDVLGAAMQAGVIRNNVINNNISNADTPGFKRKEVVFEDVLANELRGAEVTGSLRGRKLQATVITDMKDYSYRLDGNNVDVENEMVALYENSARYDVLVEAVSHNYQKINAVLSMN